MKFRHYIIPTFLISLSFSVPVFSATKNLPVPFTVQAPEANWSQPWQDACEESTIAMVDYFYTGNTFTTAKAKEEILKIISIKEKFIGKSLDEDAKTVVTIINNFLPWEAYVKPNPTIAEIKTEIDNGRPVIMPVHGRYLYNPYFQNGGPDYHTIVISGYDDQKQEFITQEPGTRHGLDFRYSYDRIINAMHDFLPNSRTKFGDKVAIFTRATTQTSADSDGDQDGLNKAGEIKYQSSLYESDTDKDGYKDGYEIMNNYLPTTPAPTPILLGTLIKSPESPMVYLFYNGIKRHIINELVFLMHGWQWFNIFTVPNSFVEALEAGEQITN